MRGGEGVIKASYPVFVTAATAVHTLPEAPRILPVNFQSIQAGCPWERRRQGGGGEVLSGWRLHGHCDDCFWLRNVLFASKAFTPKATGTYPKHSLAVSSTFQPSTVWCHFSHQSSLFPFPPPGGLFLVFSTAAKNKARRRSVVRQLAAWLLSFCSGAVCFTEKSSFNCLIKCFFKYFLWM